MNRRKQRLDRPRAYGAALGAITLAVATIVLIRAQGSAAIPITLPSFTRHTSDVAMIEFSGPGVQGQAGFSQAAVLADGSRRVAAEIRLSAVGEGVERRSPVALTVVLDVSGSMSGDKIRQARRAVDELVERMHDEDRVAVVVYNHEARLLAPLATVSSARRELRERIASIEAGGGTNIPAGLEAAQRALASSPRDMVQRMVLISDGLDGSGQNLESVRRGVRGRSHVGTTLSSLGVGTDYDERFLTTLADAGHGNYEFLATGRELSAFLTRELDEATSTVVDKLAVELLLPAGFRVVESFGVEREGSTGRVRLPVGALAAGVERSVVVEFEVDAGSIGRIGEVELDLDYRTVSDALSRHLDAGSLALDAVATTAEVVSSFNAAIRQETEAAIVDRRQAEAIEAWRDGDTARATSLARRNLGALQELRAMSPEPSPALEEQLEATAMEMDSFGDVAAGSSAGRALGLRSNAARRDRAGH